MSSSVKTSRNVGLIRLLQSLGQVVGLFQTQLRTAQKPPGEPSLGPATQCYGFETETGIDLVIIGEAKTATLQIFCAADRFERWLKNQSLTEVWIMGCRLFHHQAKWWLQAGEKTVEVVPGTRPLLHFVVEEGRVYYVPPPSVPPSLRTQPEPPAGAGERESQSDRLLSILSGV